MKWLHFLLGIYFLALAAMPCTDGTSRQKQAHCSESSLPQHQEDDHGPETCPPFCVCSCCGIILLPGFQPLKMVIVQPERPQQFPQLHAEINSVSISIWQPPRI